MQPASKARWILAGYVLMIVVSLPLTPTAVDALKAAGWLTEAVAATFAAFAVVAGYWLFVRLSLRSPRFYIPLLVLMAMLAVLVARVETHQERLHFLEYGFLAALFGNALKHTHAPPRLYVWGFAATAFAGVFDESIQALLPMRYFDVRDIVFNAAAAAFGTAVFALLYRFAPKLHRD